MHNNDMMTPSGAMTTFSIRVTGKVQGVYFRQFCKEMAIDLGIKGTVNNERDGSVRLIATGSPDQLNKLLSFCKKGPPRARVEEVQWTACELRLYDDFTILR
jgi:acylphosphatase